MAESPLSKHTDQVVEILREFICLKPRVRATLPEVLVEVKDRLAELHPEGGARRAADHHLFYRVGVVLSERGESLTMGELSEALGVPLSTATRMVNWLVESGYAERLPDEEDRRIVRVALTKAGRELYQTINGFVRQRVEQLLSRFTPEERESMVLLLSKLVGVLEETGE